MTTLENVAALLGRPVEDLVELDRRTVTLVFVGEVVDEVVVRDLVTGRVKSVTVDGGGRRVELPAMHARDRAASASVADILDSPLRELLLRHGDVNDVRVGITRSGEDRAHVDVQLLDAQQIVRRAADPTVGSITLVEEPEILDEERIVEDG